MQTLINLRPVNQARRRLRYQQGNFIDSPLPQDRKEVAKVTDQHLVRGVNEHQPRPESLHLHQQVPASHKRGDIHVDIEKNLRFLFRELETNLLAQPITHQLYDKLFLRTGQDQRVTSILCPLRVYQKHRPANGQLEQGQKKIKNLINQ